MRHGSSQNKFAFSTGVLLILLTWAASAAALDGYQDRKGVFGGFGLGGGGVFEGSNPGGGASIDFQIGGGATKNLTLCIDFDFWLHAMDSNNKFVIVPGPEVTYFFGETGLFIRGGVGAGLSFIWPDDGSYNFKAGFDVSLGLGWEFFLNSNLTMGLALEGDYIVISGDDLASVGVMFTLRRY
jgi:hypothetical protein